MDPLHVITLHWASGGQICISASKFLNDLDLTIGKPLIT